MAIGKNKRLSKRGAKGGKKKAVDPYSKKEWYDIKAPSMFTKRDVGKLIVSRTAGTRIASDGLKGRVIMTNLADLNDDEDQAFRKFRLRVDEVQGRNCLTNFHGMTFTRDKLHALVRKWQSLIEAHVDVKTTDGYLLRIFAIGFTRKQRNTQRKTAYAKSSQVKAIRKKMVDVMTKAATTNDLKELVKLFIPESLGKEIMKGCEGIYPMQNVFIRKVKVIKTPKFDVAKLLELHSDAPDTKPAAAAAPSGEDVGHSVAVSGSWGTA